MVAWSWNGQVAFNGLVQGLIYGLLAIGIVLVHRSAKIINFAAGYMGMFGAAMFMTLVLNWNVPYWVALVLGLLIGTAYGALLELAVVRRLFKAPRVILLVATIGVAQISQVTALALPDVPDSAVFPQALSSSWEIGVTVRGPQVLVLVTVPIVALALAWFLGRTLTGRCIRAAAGNADLVRLSGINPKVLSTYVWAIAGLLGTISIVLVASLGGNPQSVQGVGPLLMVRALTAAAVARFASVRTALVASMVIGVVEQLVNLNMYNVKGLVDLILLGAVLVSVSLLSKERGTGHSVFAQAPRVKALPERVGAKFWVRHLDRATLMVLLGAGVALVMIVDTPSRHQLYTSMLCYAIAGLSLSVLTGWSGQLSLGQMAFGGLAALIAAALRNGLRVKWVIADLELLDFELYPIPFLVAIPLSAIATAALAALVGLGALRVRGLFLAVSTFAFAIAALSFFYQLDPLSGGSGGRVGFERGTLFGIDLAEQRVYYLTALGALVLMTAMVGRLRRSGVGRVAIAVRDNPATAEAYTIRASIVKLRSFALSGFLAGLGGALLAGIGQQFRLGDPRFHPGQSLTLVSLVVIGGMASPAGAIVGAVWVVGLPAIWPGNELVPLLTSGVGLLILLLYFPGGLVHIAHRVRGAVYTAMERRLPPVAKVSESTPSAIGRTARRHVDAPVALSTHDVSVNFGGLRANDRITIEVRPGEIVGLIGTNGSGKTTLMNAIGGYVPSSGRIDLLGTDISHHSAASRARLGLGRTFQAAALFPELTVRETVMVALESKHRIGMIETMMFSPRMRSRERAQRSEAGELIDFLGLGRYADRPISELSTGTRRIVELAGLLALDARLLCLDEPTAGIAQRETEAMGPLLVEILRQLGASMLVIEHDMPLIMGISDRVYCLEAGRVIAAGTPSEVRNDPKVIASYLGTNREVIQRSGARPT